MTFKLSSLAPLKYSLEAHIALPTYPTRQDFVFDIASYLIRVSESKSRKLDPEDLKFSTKTLKYVFNDKMNDDEFRDRIKLIMKDMIEDGSLVKSGENLVISQTEFLKLYTISNN
jgi:hypothetical protein